MARRTPDPVLNPRLLRSFLLTDENDEYAQLLQAVLEDDYDCAFDLITVRKIQPVCDRHGNAITCLAAMEGRGRILNLLLENGGEPDQPDVTDYMWMRRPIHLAASHSHVECLAALLERGVDVNSRDGDHRTPLHWASTYGQNETVKYLISKGASVNMAQIDGFTPLHAATCLGHDEVCQTLVSNGADVNSADRDNWSALHTAACYGYKNVVRIILDAGGDIHKRTNDSETAFHVACSSGYLDIVELLYDYGAQVNVINTKGYTPFHLSVYYNKFDVAHFLATINADMNTTNDAGKTPFCLAALRGDRRMLHLMMEVGCKLSPQVSVPVTAGSDDLRESIHFMAANPFPLKSLCCFKIRKILGHMLREDVPQLPIPNGLKDLLLLKHTL